MDSIPILNLIKSRTKFQYWNIEKQYWRRKANEWRFSCELLKSPRTDQRKGRLMGWLNQGWWSWWGWNAQSLASDLNWKHSIFKFSSFSAVYIYIGFRSHNTHLRWGKDTNRKRVKFFYSQNAVHEFSQYLDCFMEIMGFLQGLPVKLSELDLTSSLSEGPSPLELWDLLRKMRNMTNF